MQNEKSGNTQSTIEHLLRPVATVKESASCYRVLELFHEDKNLYALPVVDDKDRPVGIVVRHDFTEFFSKLYSMELKGKKPISVLMDKTPVVVDRGTAIEDVARIIVDAGMQHMVTGFIISKDGRYFGMANGYDLLNEITNRKQKFLFSLAHYDQLTGLPNRTLLFERLSQAISSYIRSPRDISVLFIDLDGFKPVNDKFGHSVGDLLLKEVAARLLTHLREGDTAARLGGDEFVVTLLESDLDTATAVADRILENLRQPYKLGRRTISNISASIGLAEYPEHADNIENLLTAADNAMYAAKMTGKNQFAVFAPPGQV
jgi:diguanylate cyclase (GGDEF)-like protein